MANLNLPMHLKIKYRAEFRYALKRKCAYVLQIWIVEYSVLSIFRGHFQRRIVECSTLSISRGIFALRLLTQKSSMA